MKHPKVIKVTKISKQALETLNGLGFVIIITGSKRWTA
jgi:hypothetical protein